jgi:spore coat protein H
MKRLGYISSAVIALGAGMLWGCGVPVPLCVPGSTLSCVCSNGAPGVQICDAEGAGYAPCVCDDDPEADSAGGASDVLTPQPDSAHDTLDLSDTASDAGTTEPDTTQGTSDAPPPEPDTSHAESDTEGSALDSEVQGTDAVEETAVEVGPGVIVAEPDDEAAYIFDQGQLRTYAITVDPADLAFLDADPDAEEYVPATLEFEGLSYAVGVRYKGSVGGFLAPCTSGGAKTGKCSTKLSFTWNNPGGRFFGMKRLNFHTMQRDRSLMRDRLGYNMFRESGLAASRAVHVRLLVNGALEGLFVLVEQVDGRFTRARFTEGGKGNLYKEIWPIHSNEQTYINALETNEDDSPSVTGMLLFKQAIEYSTEAMEAWLDREMMITLIAVDRVIVNDDGAFHWWCAAGGQGNNPGPNGNHNYYWYQAAQEPRFWLIPWDLDNSFNTGQNNAVHIDAEWSQPGSCSCAFASQRAASCDTMIARWGTDWLADYELAVDAFIAGPFSAENVDAKLDTWESQITAMVSETAGLNGAITFEVWQNELAAFREMVNDARANRGYDY